ncbi:aminotransferase class IV [Oscillatoria amoena NRMC-F 0135]|nr:aminotransferase class IV [Oscillatoria amoena NRMC-F 0135]
MSRLIESIRLENGTFRYLHYHQQRMDFTIRELTGKENQVRLSEYFHTASLPATGIYKCRLLYSLKKIESLEIIPYVARPVNSLRIVVDNALTYGKKWEDRSVIDSLFKQRKECDDVLIIKNEFVTDASYSNVVFFDGLKWVTPATPLLNGVMRKHLLNTKIISEDIIRVSQIPLFRKVKLINAMLEFEGPEFSVSHIVV